MKKTIKNILFISTLGLLLAASCTSPDQIEVQSSQTSKTDPIDYVNPYMGNISHLLVPTFPTMHLPNSMMRVYPERRDFTADMIKGLPLIVTSHRGSSAFNLSPFQGDESELKPVIMYSYDNEELTPYSYYTFLDEQNIHVNFGLSSQSAKYEIEFEDEENSYLIINSRNGAINWTGSAVTGFQLIKNDTKIYIHLTPEQAPESVSVLKGGKLKDGNSSTGKNACIVLKYPKGTKNLNVGYGISFIDESQAAKNYQREVAGKDLTAIQSEARQVWNKELGKIEVEGASETEKTIFYTSLYRCYERSVNISEDGRYYSAFDGKVHEDQGRSFYTDDWIWDSYRAHHPLRVMIDSKKEEDIINSFIIMAEQMDNFWMPTFPEVTGDSRRMNSNHAVASVIDAYRKGSTNFDLQKAFDAAKGGITEKTLAPWSGMPAGRIDQFYKEKGYFPALRDGEEETVPEVHHFESRQPVAVTLGTSYDEWCLAQIAQELGKDDEYEHFLKNSLNYRNLFNSETKFFHPRHEDGSFIEPFDYKFSGGMGARKFYGENNAYTYRWDVQHNIHDLIDLMGGRESFIDVLNATFNEPLGRSKFAF